MAVPIGIPINSAGMFLFSTSSPPFVDVFNDGYSDWCDTSHHTSFIVVLVCISLIINSVEHLFMCLLFICMYSLEKWLFRPSAYFRLGCLFFDVVELCELLYILVIKAFLVTSFANIFSQSVGCFFILFP